MQVNLNTPQIKPGRLTAADMEREPGPQVSQASERTWRVVDRLILTSVCLYILGIAGGLL